MAASKQISEGENCFVGLDFISSTNILLYTVFMQGPLPAKIGTILWFVSSDHDILFLKLSSFVILV